MHAARLRWPVPGVASIAFSVSAEDVHVVEAALGIRAGDHVVCVGAGGETPLSLLATNASRVDAVDANFPQICLVSLKAEAVRHLDLAGARVLLGVDRDGRRSLALYRILRPALPAPVREFWDGHRSMISAGLLSQGATQRGLRTGRWALGRLMGPQWTAEFERLATADDVARFFARLAGDWRFRLLTRLLVNRVTVAFAYPRAGLADLGPGMTPRRYVVTRLRDVLARRPPARYPALLSYLFADFRTEDSLPAYLQVAWFPAVKAHLPRLEVVHSDLRSHLRSLPEGSVSCFALSNVADWLTELELQDLLASVARCATSDARVLIASRSRPVEPRLADHPNLVVNAALSRQLEMEDRIGYHRFQCVLRVRR